MIFIFWQNMLSIHQSSFIRSLAEVHQVILIVEEQIEERRKGDKWDVPNFGKTKIYVSPSLDTIKDIISIPSAIHVFSGVASYRLVHTAFKLAVKKGVKLGLISEPYD